MTIREYINTLPEPIRSLALANEIHNIEKVDWEESYESGHGFISDAFEWGLTAEGGNFWALVNREEFTGSLALLNPTQDLGERIIKCIPDYLSDQERARIMLKIMDAIKDHLK